MTNEELSAIVTLRSMIQHAAQRQIENGKDATVTLVLPKGVRLFGKRGPVGELLCVNSTGESVVRFKASAIVRACEKALEELSH